MELNSQVVMNDLISRLLKIKEIIQSDIIIGFDVILKTFVVELTDECYYDEQLGGLMLDISENFEKKFDYDYTVIFKPKNHILCKVHNPTAII